jgi:hypothetical protein
LNIPKLLFVKSPDRPPLCGTIRRRTNASGPPKKRGDHIQAAEGFSSSARGGFAGGARGAFATSARGAFARNARVVFEGGARGDVF